MDWSDPAARFRLIDRVGPAEYERLQREHMEQSVVTRTAGHAIRTVGTQRFGTLYHVGNTGKAFGTQAEAEKFARENPKVLTWFDLARLKAGDRIKLIAPHDIFPECVVPAGTICTIKESGLNEIWGGLILIPDDERVQKALAAWDGCIIMDTGHLNPGADAATDDEWQKDSPFAAI